MNGLLLENRTEYGLYTTKPGIRIAIGAVVSPHGARVTGATEPHVNRQHSTGARGVSSADSGYAVSIGRSHAPQTRPTRMLAKYGPTVIHRTARREMGSAHNQRLLRLALVVTVMPNS